MIAELHLGPTDPNNPKEDFTQTFNRTRTETFKSDISKFVKYLNLRYGGDKYFHVMDGVKHEIEHIIETRKIEWLNKRPPIPEQLGKLASFASKFDEVRVFLEHDSKNGWMLSIFHDDFSGGLHFYENEDFITEAAFDTIRKQFGEIHAHACHVIEGLFFVEGCISSEERDENEPIERNYIVSLPFASKTDAEKYMKTIQESSNPKSLIRDFMPKNTRIDSIRMLQVVGP